MKTIFAVLIFLSTFSSGYVFSQAKIEAEGGTQLDMGDVFKGQKAERIITIKNKGKDTLKISDVHAQCGCTAAMMTNKQLSPGEEGKLSISFNTANYDGKVSKQVYVSSNDSSNPKLTITFTTNVLTILSVDPKVVSFDNMKLDSASTRSVTITNPSPKNPLKILSIDPKSPMLKVSVMKTTLMPGESTELQAIFTPNKSGTFSGVIELMTDNKSQPKFDVNYYAWVNRK